MRQWRRGFLVLAALAALLLGTPAAFAKGGGGGGHGGGGHGGGGHGGGHGGYHGGGGYHNGGYHHGGGYYNRGFYGGFGYYPWYGYGSGYYSGYGNSYGNGYYNDGYYYPPDYQVPPPEPVPLTDADALVHVRVPANATVWINGDPTTQTGAEREYMTSDLTPGKTYRFEIRAQWQQDGRMVERTKKVLVQGGERRAVDFMTAPAPAPEPVP